MKKNLIPSETLKFTWRTASALAVTLLLLATTSGYATVQTLETFTGGLGNWTTTSPANVASGNNWVWSSSDGGFSGTIGGTLVRMNVPTSPSALGMPRFLDMVSFAGGNTLTLNSALSVSGQVLLNDPGTADTGIYIGYFNSTTPDVSRLAMRIDGPSTHPQWRVRFASGTGAAGNTGTRTTMPADFNNTLLNFSFSFTPSGLSDGSGSVSGSIYNVGTATLFTVTTFAVPASTAIFDSFGIWADSSSTTDITRTQTGWFDNVVYTVVPEPTTAMLLPLGAGFLLLARRNLRRA